MEELRDEQLVSMYLEGDEKSLDILIKRYLKPIYNFLARNTGNNKEAEDLTQDVFLRVWNNLKKFDTEKVFRTWIYQIARNASIDYLRKKKALIFSDLDTEDRQFSESLADESEPVSDRLNREEAGMELAENLQKLSLDDRTVLLLHYNEDLTFREIADVLNEPMDTVKSRHRRALLKLKKFFKEQK